MPASYQLCVDSFSLNVLAGTTKTFQIPVQYAGSDILLNCDPNPCSYWEDPQNPGCGKIGDIPYTDTTLSVTSYTDNPSGTQIPGVTVTWSANPLPGEDRWEMWVTVAVAAGTPNGTDTSRRVRLKADENNNNGITSQQLILNPSIVVEGVYNRAALFTFPHQGGGFYIDTPDLCTNTTEVDASLSLSAMYRVLLVGRLTNAAINNLGSWTSTNGVIKLVDGSSPSNEIWSSQTVYAYPAEWYSAYGDPFNEGTPYENLRIVGDRVNPPEIPYFQTGYPPSSAYQNTALNFQRLGGHIYYTVGGTQYAIDVPDRPIVKPYVRSVISTDDTAGGVPQVEELYSILVGQSVTVYPAVANDYRSLGASSKMTIEVGPSATGPWSTLSGASLTDSSSFTYNDGTDEFDYDSAQLVFTPTAAGQYYLRVKPTADANPNVRSIQVIHIDVAGAPVTSVVLGPGATGQSRNDAFYVNVTTSCSSGTYQIALVNPPEPYPYGSYLTGPSDPHDAIELYIDGVLRGTLGSVNAYFPLNGSTPFSGTVGSGRIQLKIPAYVVGSTKLTSQAFSHIVSLKAVVNSQEFFDASPVDGLTYTRIGATIDINGAGNQTTLTPCGPGGGTPTTTTFTRTVSWANLAADTAITLSSPLAASNGVITYSPQSFTPTAPNLVSGSRTITCTYTHPAPVISVIVDTTIVATATPLVGSPFSSVGALKIFPCAVAPGTPVLSYYKPVLDKGIVLSSGTHYSNVGAISRLVYSNTVPTDLWSNSAAETASHQRAYLKITVGGLPDTTNGFTIEASPSPTFNTVYTLTVPSGAPPNTTWDVQLAAGVNMYAQRKDVIRGSYVPSEIALSITASSSVTYTDPFPIFYVRTKITGQTAYSNVVTVTAIAHPYIAAPTPGADNESANLYLEAGSGLFVCPSVEALFTSGPMEYFSSSGSPLFTIQGSTGLLQSGKTAIFPYPTSQVNTTRYGMWSMVDGAASGDYTLDIMYGLVPISRVSCKVVATNHVNLRIGGSVDASLSPRGTQVSPTYNAASVPGVKTFLVLDGAGATVSTVSGTLQFMPSLSNTSPVYAIIYFGESDPIPGADSNGKTVVAASTTLTSVSGCSLTETTDPSRVRVVPIVTGTNYPPYTGGFMNGLRLPAKFDINGTEYDVTDCNFGLVVGIGPGGAEIPLNVEGTSKQIGYPTTNPQYLKMEVFQFFLSEYRLKTTNNGYFSVGSTGITSIVMQLKFTLGAAGCVLVTKTLPITSEQCVDGAITYVDLDALNYRLYSCDVYPRLAPAGGGGVGYDTTLTNPTFQAVYDYGYPLVSPEFDATHIPAYGIEVIGSVIGTAGSPSSLNPIKYVSRGTTLTMVMATNNGSPSCTKRVYKATYEHQPTSAWLPKPLQFFVGPTSSAPLQSVQNLYNNDVLWVQLQAGLDPAYNESKLETDYRLVFTNTATGASFGLTSPYEIFLDYKANGDGAGFTQQRCIKFIPTAAVPFVRDATYSVSVVHKTTRCAYTAYSPGSPVGTITFKGDKTAATVNFGTIQALPPCFTTVPVTGTGTGLDTVRKFSVFDAANPTAVIAGWTKLSVTSFSANAVSFSIPRNAVFPTTPLRNSKKSMAVVIQFYTADDIPLLPTNPMPGLTLTLETPRFVITESNYADRTPSIGTIPGGYQNVFTVRGADSSCCSSCSSGTCVQDTLADATVVWTSSLPSWLANTTPGGALPNTYTISNDDPIPGSSGFVRVTATVTYYQDSVTYKPEVSYTLTPTSAFAVSTDSLPSTSNGAQNYSAFISTVNKPCTTLDWTISNRMVSGADRSLPLAVTIARDSGNANRAKITWTVVSDPGAVFPPGGLLYKFRVRAQCQGGAQVAEGDVTLRVFPSVPVMSGVSPVVGYFDIVNETVTITGSNFSSDAVVKFDTLPATSVVVNGPGTSITCIPPVVPDSGGPDVLMTVSVTNGDGGTVSFAQKYTYTRKLTPVLLGISPSSGTPLGGTKVLLTGANFEPSSVVTIDGVEQPIVAITPSSLLFITFPHSVGDVDVVVSNSNCGGAQSECPSISYTFRVSPQITAVTPYSTSATGQDPVFIVGTGFYETESAKPRVLVDNFEIPASLIVYRMGVG